MIAAFKYIVLFAFLLLWGLRKGRWQQPFDRVNTLPLRGVLCLLIVITHLGGHLAESGYIGWDLVGRYLNNSYFAVSMFFFLSGYGLSTAFEQNGKAYLQHFWRKRLRVLLPALVGFSLLYVVVKYYWLKWPMWAIFSPLHGTFPIEASWYVYALLLLYVAFYLIYLFVNSRWTRIALTSLFLVGYAVVVSRLLHWSAHWWNTTPAFVVGLLFPLYERRFRSLLEQQTRLVVACLCLLMLCFSFSSIVFYCCFLPVVVVALVARYGFVQWRWLCWVGRYSYELFLFHQLLMAVAFNKTVS